jgi:nucleotide-binding universal stress UspA family protein
MSILSPSCVLAPVDFSDESMAAVAEARAMVDDPAKLHVIHVLTVMNVAEPGIIWDTIDDASRIEHATEALREKFADATIDVEIGDPAHEIADYAEKISAELVVLPSHGRNALTRFLIGSTAERVVRLAHCPVLVLKPRK